MESLALWQWLLFAALIWLIVSSRTLREQWQRLADEFEQRLPVFSAETTRGQEAEFIRDRLPKPTPRVVALVFAALLFGAGAAWWWLG